MATLSHNLHSGSDLLLCLGSLADSLFLTLLDWLGPYAFFIYALIALLGGIFCYFKVPETKGCSLAEIQSMLGKRPKLQLPDTQNQNPGPHEESGEGGPEGKRPFLLHNIRFSSQMISNAQNIGMLSKCSGYGVANTVSHFLSERLDSIIDINDCYSYREDL